MAKRRFSNHVHTASLVAGLWSPRASPIILFLSPPLSFVCSSSLRGLHVRSFLVFSVFLHLQCWHSHLPPRTVVIVSSQPLILVRRSPESPTLHVLFLRHFSFHCLSSEILLLAEDLPEAAVKARPTTSKLPPASVSSSCLSVIFFSPLFLIQRSRILAAPPLFHLLVV
jgi:hypothetical protein